MTAPLAVHEASRLPESAAEALGELAAGYGALTMLVAGHDAAWEQEQMVQATALGVPLLPVRLWGAEVEIGPPWREGAAGGCPLCQVAAHLRTRGITDPPRRMAAGAGHAEAALHALSAAVHLACHERLQPGETVLVSPRGSSRHRVAPQTGCPACDHTADTPIPSGEADSPHGVDPELHDVDLDADLRQIPGPDLALESLTGLLVDDRYGPVVGLQSVPDSPASLMAAVHARHGSAAEAAGYGRGRTVAAASRLALLERLERSGSEAVVRAARPLRCAYDALPGRALDPRRLGVLAPEQYAHPSCRVDPFAPEDVLRWIPARAWGTADTCWVPLEAGSYHVHPEPRPGRKWGRVLYESSNGCALGATLDEAALHALLEVVERDAFLLTWWAGQPVPRVDWSSVSDTTALELRATMRTAGYEVHLCVITQDVPVPAVWALAVNPRSAEKYSLTTAAAHPDPATAVRAAVAELAPLVLGDVVTPDPARARRLRADRWNVTDLDDHIQWYSIPDAAPAFEPFLSGPLVPLADAFPVSPLHGARTLGEARDTMLALLTKAGMDEVLVVDQTGREHRAAGLRAVRVLVPGSIPLTFGFAHQCVFALPRLLAATGPPGPSLDRLTVHPFP